MRAVRLFSRAGAVIKYVLRAASTSKNSDGEQRALRKFSGQNLDLSSLKRNVLRQVIWLTLFNQSQQCLVGDDVKLRLVSSSMLQWGTPGERSRRSKAF